MSSSSVSKRFVSVSILAVVTLHFPFIQSVLSLNQTNAYLQHVCIKSDGTYKSESSYESSVKVLLDFIGADLDYGFGSGSAGSNGSAIYAKFQCRGDTSESKCRSCLTTAFSGIRRLCPHNKGRIIWYDNCILDLSSIYTYGEIDNKHIFYLYNAKDVNGDTKLFNKNTRALLYKLKEKASRKEQKPYRKDYMYAAGEESLGKMKLYAMVQCTQDLSVKNCSVCLDGIMAKLPRCCNGKQGGRVLNPNCNFRYEFYPFVQTQKTI
ncbi:PREDICTED: putative cysteine-rich repeat secretory protein 10 [Camelina sativa]|uniref:Cysteine-rich repeat secretory protein 10 n=1 Tax=Camelina sativa TaxID=90675 RepID=A0ABM0X5R9_CAMSA|nr:PREDICTED: putative cysteine-rich repeat secretory protein 10 [Camelina sativa]